MKRLIFIVLLSIYLCADGYSTRVKSYAKVLSHLTTEQYINMVLAYSIGKEHNMGLLLTAIVWKESSFGKFMVNSRDGQHGSFGLGQILLDTSMARHNVRTKSGKARLKLKLLTDHDFNLNEAVTEIKFWKNYHKNKMKRSKWRLYTVASYNTGKKSYNSSRGKKYANDVAVRIEALKLFFSNSNINVDKAMDKELNKIGKELKK